jgi:hypothetical protein
MKKSVYLLTTALAISTGVNVYLAGAGIDPVWAIDTTYSQTVSLVLGPTAKSSWEQFLVQKFCPEVDTELGLTPGKCDIPFVREYGKNGFMIVPIDVDDWQMAHTPVFPATITPNIP